MIHDFRGHKPSIHETAFVAWNAEVLGEASLGEGSSVWFGAIVRADIAKIHIGRESNVQDGTVVHVDRGIDCMVGDGVTIGHRAVVHACTVGDYCLIGMGAVILDRAEIGSESIVGAGALVTQGKKFPPRSMILGSPAKWVRELTPEEIEGLHSHAATYARLAKETKHELEGGEGKQG